MHAVCAPSRNWDFIPGFKLRVANKQWILALCIVNSLYFVVLDKIAISENNTASITSNQPVGDNWNHLMDITKVGEVLDL